MTNQCLLLFCVVFLGIFHKVLTSSCSIETLQLTNEIPLAKSFGLVLKGKPDKDTIPHDRYDRKSLDEYLNTITTLDEADPMADDVGEGSRSFKPAGLQRRRRVPFEDDSIQQRRYRSEVSRREKLNTQGMQSHNAFIKEKSLNNGDDSSE